jgi:hypothetical protein
MAKMKFAIRRQSAVAKKAPAGDAIVYQFKITLVDSTPPVWRRIQMPNGTLDQLHVHIQTAMGWMNSHLHDFAIGKQRFGHPELLQENFDDLDYEDSTTTFLNELVPSGRKQLRILYQYDFGDSWEHEVLFEGCPPAEEGRAYPLCLEGKRACPPEDCGGVGGYADLLLVLADPKHKQHREMLNWLDWIDRTPFDPEAFDAVEATRRMQAGLPDWRDGADLLP